MVQRKFLIFAGLLLCPATTNSLRVSEDGITVELKGGWGQVTFFSFSLCLCASGYSITLCLFVQYNGHKSVLLRFKIMCQKWSFSMKKVEVFLESHHLYN